MRPEGEAQGNQRLNRASRRRLPSEDYVRMRHVTAQFLFKRLLHCLFTFVRHKLLSVTTSWTLRCAIILVSNPQVYADRTGVNTVDSELFDLSGASVAEVRQHPLEENRHVYEAS